MAKGPVSTPFNKAVVSTASVDSGPDGCTYLNTDLEGLALIIGCKIGDEGQDLLDKLK